MIDTTSRLSCGRSDLAKVLGAQKLSRSFTKISLRHWRIVIQLRCLLCMGISRSGSHSPCLICCPSVRLMTRTRLISSVRWSTTVNAASRVGCTPAPWTRRRSQCSTRERWLTIRKRHGVSFLNWSLPNDRSSRWSKLSARLQSKRLLITALNMARARSGSGWTSSSQARTLSLLKHRPTLRIFAQSLSITSINFWEPRDLKTSNPVSKKNILSYFWLF